MAASTIVNTRKKIIQVGILVILGNQEIYFRGNLKVNMMNIVYSSMDISIFSFYEKVTPSLEKLLPLKQKKVFWELPKSSVKRI